MTGSPQTQQDPEQQKQLKVKTKELKETKAATEQTFPFF